LPRKAAQTARQIRHSRHACGNDGHLMVPPASWNFSHELPRQRVLRGEGKPGRMQRVRSPAEAAGPFIRKKPKLRPKNRARPSAPGLGAFADEIRRCHPHSLRKNPHFPSLHPANRPRPDNSLSGKGFDGIGSRPELQAASISTRLFSAAGRELPHSRLFPVFGSESRSSRTKRRPAASKKKTLTGPPRGLSNDHINLQGRQTHSPGPTADKFGPRFPRHGLTLRQEKFSETHPRRGAQGPRRRSRCGERCLRPILAGPRYETPS